MDKDKKNIIGISKLWFPVFICMAFIFYVSSISGTNIPFLFCNQDTLFHLFIYLLLAYCVARAIKGTWVNIGQTQVFLLTIAFGIFYGIIDELHQVFVPFRTASFSDILTDGFGSILGCLLFTKWRK